MNNLTLEERLDLLVLLVNELERQKREQSLDLEYTKRLISVITKLSPPKRKKKQ